MKNLFKNFDQKVIIKLFTESLLIIVSVLVALFIDQYKERRNEKQMEIEYLTGIRNDLATDTSNYLWRNKDFQTTLSYCDSILSIAGKKMEVPEGMLSGFDHVFSILISINFQNSPTYESMKSSGHLKLIQNKLLQEGINEYYSHGRFVDRVVNQELERITEERRRLRNKAGIPLNFNYEKTEVAYLLKNAEVYNTTVDSLESIHFVLGVIEYKLKSSEKLIAQINKYLEQA